MSEWVEQRQRAVGLAAGPLLSGVVWAAPFAGLSPEAHRLAGILTCVVVYWIAEPIPLPVTALLGTAACVLAGLGSAKGVFAAYAHPIIFLFIGSFFLAEAMAVHGLDRRLAMWMLSWSWVSGRPARMLLAAGTVTAVLSMWISNTAATALMLPIAAGLLRAIQRVSDGDHRRYGTGLLLFLAYASAAGGMTTIIGTPPNLIGVGLIEEQTGQALSFLVWMAFGIPIGLLMLGLFWAVLWRTFPAPTAELPGFGRYLADERASLGPWSRGQFNASLAFGVAVIGWVLPGAVAAFVGPAHPSSQWLEQHLPNELVALLAAGLLFLLPADRHGGDTTLTWRQATNINWGTILLFGGGLAFGDLMMKTGLSRAIGEGFVRAFGAETLWELTALSIVAATLLTELVSNTAAAGMLVPLAVAVAQSAGVSPVPPALGACLGASLGFAMPVATPPNALVYGTGHVPIRHMVRMGLCFDLLGAVIIWVMLRLLCPILGLG
jgi:sodium-dependent dicarboxylate transporter 2/3/5